MPETIEKNSSNILEKSNSVVATSSIILANLIAILNYVDTIREWMLDKFGSFSIEIIQLLGLVTTIVLLIIFFYAGYKVFIKNVLIFKAYIFIFLAFSILASCMVHVKAISATKTAPVVAFSSSIIDWQQRLLSVRNPKDGGFMPGNFGSAESQPWTTGQILSGLIVSNEINRLDPRYFRDAFNYLESVRGDGGWGYWETTNISVTEINSWVMIAYLYSLNPTSNVWRNCEKKHKAMFVVREFNELIKRQINGNGFAPLNKELLPLESFTRTYSTVMAVWAMVEAYDNPVSKVYLDENHVSAMKKGLKWLIDKYNYDVGWQPNPNRDKLSERFLGLSAQTIYVIMSASKDKELSHYINSYISADIFADHLLSYDYSGLSFTDNTRVPDLDVHFRSREFKSNFILEGSTYLWYPWTLLAIDSLLRNKNVTETNKASLLKVHERLIGMLPVMIYEIGKGGEYEIAETLFSISAIERNSHINAFNHAHP